ncbi:hypothetical protein MSIMFI_03667 [Mycobacterium simulans]|uniref:DUF2695 domain-containing protein n=1 Tax=Mycobacterium simulans TaxID=627089 RepID=UPI00174E90D0|nr:DUF2695 domain-containing protein [Mycobacterium simulans]SON62146.1 hypothetical protein MSIMFI_03667 [Mycobacterium simulans]
MATPPDKARRKFLLDAYQEAQRLAGPQLTLIDYDQLDELLNYIEERSDDQPCDHSPRHAQRWAESRGIDWPELQRELREFGGYCDCEILFNVEPDEVFG